MGEDGYGRVPNDAELVLAVPTLSNLHRDCPTVVVTTVTMVMPHHCYHGEDGGEGVELVGVSDELLAGRVTQGDEGERGVAVWNQDDLLGLRQ